MNIYIAGAGAGKTTTMADNIIEIRNKIEENKIIFCITFTNNAVACIEKKLKKYYGEIPSNIMVCTIHSFLYREFVKPYFFLLYGKQYEKISIAELPKDPKYKKGKIKRLEDMNILHQIAIPERAKWIIYQKSKDAKVIKGKRAVIKNNFTNYCGAICIDEAQDIDPDMQIIVETLDEMKITLLLMGDPKQDLKGHKSLKTLVEKYKDDVEYIKICHRCPQKHLEISNLLVDSQEIQHSEKMGGLVTIQFETNISCSELIRENTFDLLYISKKQGKYDTHEKNKRTDTVSAIAEEIEAVMSRNHTSASEIILKRVSYYYAERLVESYKKTKNRQQAMKDTFKDEKLGNAYGILINMIPDNSDTKNDDSVIVKSIDSIKGQEGNDCLFILTTDLAAYLFGDKKEDTKTKNKLYVALTRSLDKLTILITEEVETKYGKKRILEFFNF